MFGFGKKASLKGMHVAIITTDGVEHTELTEPWKALKKAGAEVFVIGHKLGTFATVMKTMQRDTVPIDATVDEVRTNAFDALYIPGSTLTVDKLKKQDSVIHFIQAFIRSHKPIAAMSSGPALLALAGAVQGHTMTSSLAVRDELHKAGVVWIDQKVVEDGTILTGRGPKDLKAFTKQIVKHFAKAE